MAITLLRLSDLAKNSDEYDETFLPPTKEVLSFVRKILENCREKTPEDITPASPAPIGDGGLFLQWETEMGCVQLIVPPNPDQAFLYIRKGSENEIIREALGEKLVDLLASIAQIP